ncbi:EcoKI restriction-modification system protein HsdS [Eubacterium limosum]|uniref:EcoKI restriction-modification system protein HsdS n=1 Tax=Eubacterium limosum TaxID=1736 RepID=A0A6N3E8R3_EUBLI
MRKHRKNWKNSLVYLENKAWRAGHKAQFFFTNAWEQRKLGEVGNTFTGLSGKTASDFGHGEASFITYMNVFSNPISDTTMVEHVEIDSKQREVEVGDVFFTTSSETPEEVGMSSVLKEKSGVTYLNSFCFGFRPTEKFDLDYLAFMLRSEPVRSQIKLLAQGISRFNISKTKMMEIDIQVPELDEQIAIGRYFSQLDHFITLHQRKCENFKIQCCQNCFLNKIKVCLKMLDKFKAPGNNEMIFSRVNSTSENLFQ